MQLQGIFLGGVPKSFKTKSGIVVNQVEVTVRDDSLGVTVCLLPGDFVSPSDLSRVSGSVKGARFNPFAKRVEYEIGYLSVAAVVAPESALPKGK